MTACLIYNAINVVAWCMLACHFGHWWIALFPCVTTLTYKEHRKGGEEIGD